MRFLVRVIGFLAVATGFVALIIDGTRSLADSRLTYTPVRSIVEPFAGARLADFGAMIQRDIHPLLWDPVLVTLLNLPLAAVGLVLGFLLMRLGQPKPEPIGFDTKR